MNITISASHEIKKDVIYRMPITGDAHVAKVLPGTFSSSAVVITPNTSGTKPSSCSAGTAASYYGAKFKGDGEIAGVTTMIQGGTSSTPYTQTTTTFMGVENA